MGKAIETKNLHFSYDGNPVLQNISLSIEEGEFLSILGPNGSGKTTFIKALTGIIKDIRGGFAHYRDIDRMDSITKIEFHFQWKKAKNASTSHKTTIKVGNHDLKQLVTDVSNTLPVYLQQFQEELQVKFINELKEFNDLKQRIIRDQENFQSSGITLTESDFIDFKIVDKL